MSIKSDNENMAKLYTEGTMSASDKKKAAEVKKMYSADEPMGQAAGLKLKAAAKDLDRKYGKDWRKEEDYESEDYETTFDAEDAEGIGSGWGPHNAEYDKLIEAWKDLQGVLAIGDKVSDVVYPDADERAEKEQMIRDNKHDILNRIAQSAESISRWAQQTSKAYS